MNTVHSWDNQNYTWAVFITWIALSSWKIGIQWITIRENNCIIHWKKMYPLDINWSLHTKLTCILSPQHAQRVEASQAMMSDMRVVRWPVLLRWWYTRRFATTIFSATQHCNIVATLFRMITTLLRHCFEWLQHCSSIATLCCAKIVVANRPV